MPSTPNFAITYPCLTPLISMPDFSAFATDVEAALAAVDAEAVTATHNPYAFALGNVAAAFGVESILTYTGFPANSFNSGITFNAAAGTFTIVTPGLYSATAESSSNQSTLTMTSQRIAVFVNGVLFAVRKYRGTNPVTVGALVGSYSTDVPLIAGDVVTFRYLWTGTGALTGDATGNVSLAMLTSP